MTTAPTGPAVVAATLIRGAALVPRPWKNGGGTTREVAAFPRDAGLDAFVWRVSIAEVAQDGPFSRFDGIDRTLVLLAGKGMRLDGQGDGVDGRAHVLDTPFAVASFAGETAIDARLLDGPTRDFNLMVRRDAARGELAVLRGGARVALTAEVVLLFCAAGALDLTLGQGERVTLAADDTLCLDAPCELACTLHGDGVLLAASLHYRKTSPA